MSATSVLDETFERPPEQTSRIETAYRRIQTALPGPRSAAALQKAAQLFPRANCYQPPIVWETADGFTIEDGDGNRWIDFTSTAVMTNTGHGHPAIREAVAQHVAGNGLMAQFSFASSIRIELAQRLVELAPAHCEKVYFWTVGSEAIECALRLAREQGLQRHPEKFHILTHSADYHGWTLGAHQLSGGSARKAWLSTPDSAIHHLPFPNRSMDADSQPDWSRFLADNLEALERQGVGADQVCAVFIETLQGWGAVPLPTPYVEALRRWADAHNVLLIFDEVQTGFGRTGKLFAHEHYGVRADLICIGKGVTSTLPLAAVLGPAEVLDRIAPAEITTTHAAHPVACAAALANLDVLESESLVAEAARKGQIAERELQRLAAEFPAYVDRVCGLGLLRGIHVRDPGGDGLCPVTARDWTWESVKQGVMLFQVNRPSIKVCPSLTIDDAALVEGISALGDAIRAMS